MKTLAFSQTLRLPIDVVTQTLAFIGRKGSGKTYAAGKLVELLLSILAQVVVFDPIGNWYGLRLLADGKRKGFDIPVIGGLRGDVPLEAGAGSLVANLIVDKGISAIVDVSQFSKTKRKLFITEFAEELFMLRKRNPAPMHIVLEEAQLFCPQRAGRGDERMVGAIEDIVRLGRNYGIGVSLLSQRPQSVNKEALNQAEALITFQLNGAHERKAIQDWVQYQGIDVRKMVNQLPSLRVGTAFFWSPQWLDKLEKIRINKKTTFDSSATPALAAMKRLGHRSRKQSKREPKALKAADLTALREAMSEIVERSAANDPTSLRKIQTGLLKRIAQLEHQLEQRIAAPAAARIVEVPVFTEKDWKRLEAATSKISVIDGGVQAYVTALEETSNRVKESLHRIETGMRMAAHAKTTPPPETSRYRSPKFKPRPFPVPPAPTDTGGNGEVHLKTGAKRMLGALVTFWPGTMTKRQIAGAVKMKPTGGTFNSYWSNLKKGGFIQPSALNPSHWEITEAGQAFLGATVERLPNTIDARMDFWKKRLKTGAARILQVVHDEEPIHKNDIAAAVDMVPSGGTFNSYLSVLRTNRLIESGSTGAYGLHPWLVGGR